MRLKLVLLCAVFGLAELVCFVHPLVGSKKPNRLKDCDVRSDVRLLWKEADSICGPRCLWQIGHVYGRKYSLNAVASMAGTDLQHGTTIKGMVEAAQQMGLQAKVMKSNIKALSQDQRVAILLLNKVNHYAILDKIDDEKVRLLDADKFRTLSIKELKSIWDGYAILIGDHGDGRTDRLQRYFGTGLQISGLLILLAIATCGVKCTYSYLSKRQ